MSPNETMSDAAVLTMMLEFGFLLALAVRLTYLLPEGAGRRAREPEAGRTPSRGARRHGPEVAAASGPKAWTDHGEIRVPTP